MSFPYVFYNRETQEIVSAVVAPTEDQRPPEGPWDGDLWVCHGACDIQNERVRRGTKGRRDRIAPKTKTMKAKEQRDRDWFDFRAKRSNFMAATDFKLNGDYPISDAEKADLKADRQALRDMPKTMRKDPEQALSLLEEMRRKHNVE